MFAGRVRMILTTALLALALVAAPASAVTVTPTGTILGKVESTWLAKGGTEVLGWPRGTETKIVAYSRNTYHQHMVDPTTRAPKSTVYWDGSQGGKVWLAGKVPNLSGVSAERDALGRYGFKSGVLYRSARLCSGTTAAKRLMTAMLHDEEGNKGTVIDLRTSGTCTEPSFPSTIVKTRISVPSHADYSRYVTGSTERKQFGRILTAIANAPGAVWVHCTAGKDRTGWTVMMVMFALGAGPGVVLDEFELTDEADQADFYEGLDAIAENYSAGSTTNGRDEYIRTILNAAYPGSADATLAKLREKLG